MLWFTINFAELWRKTFSPKRRMARFRTSHLLWTSNADIMLPENWVSRNLDHLNRAVPKIVTAVFPHSEREITYNEPAADHNHVSAPTYLQSANTPVISASGRTGSLQRSGILLVWRHQALLKISLMFSANTQKVRNVNFISTLAWWVSQLPFLSSLENALITDSWST